MPLVSSTIVRRSQTGCAPAAFCAFTRGLLQVIPLQKFPNALDNLVFCRGSKKRRKKLLYALISARLIYVHDSLRVTFSSRRKSLRQETRRMKRIRGGSPGRLGRKKARSSSIAGRRPCPGRFSGEKTGKEGSQQRCDKLCGMSDNRRCGEYPFSIKDTLLFRRGKS